MSFSIDEVESPSWSGMLAKANMISPWMGDRNTLHFQLRRDKTRFPEFEASKGKLYEMSSANNGKKNLLEDFWANEANQIRVHNLFKSIVFGQSLMEKYGSESFFNPWLGNSISQLASREGEVNTKQFNTKQSFIQTDLST